MKNIPECDAHLAGYANILVQLIPANLEPIDVLKCAEPRAKELAGDGKPSAGHYLTAVQEFLKELPKSTAEAVQFVTARANKLREEI